MVIYLWKMVISHGYGWWFQPTPLKNDGVKVSWDDDIPNMMGKIIHSNVPNHQPVTHDNPSEWQSVWVFRTWSQWSRGKLAEGPVRHMLKSHNSWCPSLQASLPPILQKYTQGRCREESPGNWCTWRGLKHWMWEVEAEKSGESHRTPLDHDLSLLR